MTASKNKPSQTRAERDHAGRIALLPCAVCECPPPSEVHEITQADWFTVVPLCAACHRGAGGIHGNRALWRVRKMTELHALSNTVRMLMGRVATWRW